MVAGHEFIHAFDVLGRQFDESGAVRDWWTDASEKAFAQKTKCLADQIEKYPTVGGGHLNPRLVLGEVMGDQAGLRLSYTAWLKTLPAEIQNDKTKLAIEKKKFFVDYGQAWCAKSTDEFERVDVTRNPHPPARHRVNSSLSNFPEFAETFSCQEGAKLAPVNRCVVW